MNDTSATIYVAVNGNDQWSGRLPQPGADGKDGPLATLQRARDIVRKIDTDQDITVMVRQGCYFLTEPLTFYPQDSGRGNAKIIYRNYPDEEVIISGGRPLTGWHETQDGFWETAWDSNYRFSQLWLNGQVRRRPRWPQHGFNEIAALPGVTLDTPYQHQMSSFEFHPGDIRDDWTHLNDIEVVVLHFWVTAFLPIASVDAANHIVTLANPSRRRLSDDHTRKGNSFKGARYYVNNVLEAIEPGQWYGDWANGIVRYMPQPGETIADSSFIVPSLGQLLRFQGDPAEQQWVRNIELHGLQFSHTRWELKTDQTGDEQAADSVGAAIYAQGMRHCALIDCNIVDCSTYGIELGQGCQHKQIVGCELTRLGGGGIKVNGGDARTLPPFHTRATTITDNQIHNIGTIYHQAVGILLQHTSENLVAHNHVHHTYYTGISVGWVWGYKPSVSHDNIIEYNHIHDIGQGWLSDMGAIYTLGTSPGTVVRYNLVHDVQSWGYGGWGLYADEGSSYIRFENNVVYGTKCGGWIQHYGYANQVRNNIFMPAQVNQLHLEREEKHLSFIFEHNIVCCAGEDLLSQDSPSDTDETGKWDTGIFFMDKNIYHHVNGEQVMFGEKDWQQWQQSGHDTHSIIANPQLGDICNGDYHISEDSPAVRLGFQPFSLADVGPRPRR